MGTDLNLNRLFQQRLTGPNSDAAQRAQANRRLTEASRTQEEGAAGNIGAQNAFAAAFRGNGGGFTPPTSDLSASQRVGGVDQTQQTSGVNFQPGVQRVQGASPADQMRGIDVSNPSISGGAYGPASLAGNNAYDQQRRQPSGTQFAAFA